MPKAIATVPTILKKRVIGAGDLATSEKISVPQGKEFLVTGCYPDRNQHIRLVLASPVLADDKKTKLSEVYAYAPHVEVEGFCEEIRLKVPYCSQLDNDTSIFGAGWRQCNTTSNTMLADFLLEGAISKSARDKGYPEPESFYMRVVAKYGDTVDHDAQTKALKELGIESYFSYTLSGKDLINSLSAGIPIVVGFAYKGSGHICVVVGYEPSSKTWMIHDPYGIRHGYSDSYDVGANGAFDQYSNDVMQAVFWDQGGEAGWGRIVTSVRGKTTGLKSGL